MLTPLHLITLAVAGGYMWVLISKTRRELRAQAVVRRVIGEDE